MNASHNHTLIKSDQEHVRSIAFDLVLTLLTFYLWNIWVQYKQMKALNSMMGKNQYSFLKWGLFSLLTFGFYHIYHEYRMTVDLRTLMPEVHEMEPIISIILTCFGFFPVADAIQQSHINKFYGATGL